MDTLGIVVLLLVTIELLLLGCILTFTSVRKKVKQSRIYRVSIIAIQTFVFGGFIIIGIIYLL